MKQVSITQENNKRIAKNTLLLYIRMLFIMAVSLYTSRIILATLGISDYGIYNVVGGIVIMLSFLNGAMSSATQRYLTFELGKGNLSRFQSVFSTTIQIHVLLSLCIIILAETMGLWFLLNKMQIPVNRLTASIWVYQCSIITAVISIMSVPYNAVVIAHERMSAFAYISVLEVALKLIIVFLLPMINCDRLITYSLLIMLVQLLIRLCYSIYCNRHFKEAKYKHQYERNLMKEIFSFAGWSFVGHFASVMHTQGVNVLLNMFFGPIVNAARGIAVQVQMAVFQFCGNFQTALNPQITKTYAQGDLESMNRLIYRSSRFSFFLLFMLTFPVILEAGEVLSIWLKNVPNDTVVFLRIMLCTSLLWTFSNPMSAAVQATGKVKKYNMVCGCILLAVLPCSWGVLKMGFPAYSVFVVHFFLELISQIVRMYMLCSLVKFSIKEFLCEICPKIVSVVGVSIILPLFFFMYMEQSVIRLVVVVFISFVSTSIAVYCLGLTSNERYFIKEKVILRLYKK